VFFRWGGLGGVNSLLHITKNGAIIDPGGYDRSFIAATSLHSSLTTINL